MATITVRRIGNDGEPAYGNGTADFISDIDAVAQIISTRLNLFQGEWWEDQSEGLPLWQKMLGVMGSGKNPQAIALLIQQRILGTPYVTGVSRVATGFNAETRAFQFSCVVDTQFEQVALTNYPTPNQGAF